MGDAPRRVLRRPGRRSARAAARYALSPDDVARIRTEMAEQFGEIDGVFELQPGGFTAWLHYRIWACAAM